jgi:hypothetical protein
MNVLMKIILGVLVALAPGAAAADKSFTAGKGATWDCGQDAVVSVSTSNGTYSFTGACKDVRIDGSGLTVSIDSVDKLAINGARNTVTVTTLGDIVVAGGKNTVSYATSIKGAPGIRNLGRDNTIKEAAAANVIDCARQKEVSIAKSKARYTLTATCDKVSISGSDNAVSIEAAKNLAITGSGNTVDIARTDKIAALGANNRVTYGGGLTLATPKVAAAGKGNVIAPAAPSPQTGSTTTAPAVVVGIDCGNTPSHSIDGNSGTYVYLGACEQIAISGNHNKVTADSVKLISITGNSNTVSTTAVDRLTTTGNTNVVAWKRGISATKPSLSNAGNGNKLSQTK